MFAITTPAFSSFNLFFKVLRAVIMLCLVSGMVLSLHGCTSAEENSADAQHLRIAIPPELADFVTAVRFDVTDADGVSQSAVVPLIEQGLPDTVAADLAGHRFADWFVVLKPGTYRVVATPLGADDKPSDICGAAGGSVSVFDGVTTEIVLVSNCDAHSGGLDIVLVFNHNPFIEKLVIAPNKFLCIGRHVVLNARASDEDGDDLSYDWQVTGIPAAANASDYALEADGPPPWQAKFSATLAGEYALTLTVSDGHGTTSLSFPIYVTDCDDPAPASVRGVKWQDRNGNAERDSDEPGLPGVLIYSDLNDNSAFDPGEPATRSLRDDPDTDFDESGHYWLEGLRPGSHSIREVVPDGFEQTFPGTSLPPVSGVDQGAGVNVTPAAINLSLGSAESFDTDVSISFDFVCIRAFDIAVVAPDAPAGTFQNLTGVVENGCGGDVSVFDIRLTGDGSLHQFDIQFVDDEFGGVLGTIPVQISGTGSDGGHVVLLESGGVIEGLDFGNQPSPDDASVHGRKWHDSNGNGRQEQDEPGLPGVVIYSDLNNNAEPDAGEPRTLSMQDDPLTDFDESGLYWLQGLQPGEHIIREVVPDGFTQTFPTLSPVAGDNSSTFADLSPDAINLTLAAGAVHDTQVSMTIAPLCIRPYEIDLVAPLAPTGVFQNLTGVLINGCGGDTSTFDIRLTGQGGVTRFDILFVDAEFGGTLATLPVQINDGSGGFHRILLAAGDVVDSIDFGNTRLVTR